jgi:putative tryptophan/tyrosine transport system substrate-binding protein
MAPYMFFGVRYKIAREGSIMVGRGQDGVLTTATAWVAFIILLALTAMIAAVSSPGNAQTTPPPKRLGVLASGACPVPGAPAIVFVLPHRLAELGWIEGRNLVIDCVSAAGRMDQLPALAGELVARRPDVLFGASTPIVRPLKEATATIPIVMMSADPVREALVTNLARPEANLTGVGQSGIELFAKRIELLKEILPRFARLAIIARIHIDPGFIAQMEKDATVAAKTLGFEWQRFGAEVPEDFAVIFERLQAEGFDAAYVVPSSPAVANQRRIGELASNHRIATLSEFPSFAKNGILLTYGVDLNSVLSRAAEYIDKILRSAKPADLPVEQPTKFELVINLQTAKALGLTIPESFLLRADEVIE